MTMEIIILLTAGMMIAAIRDLMTGKIPNLLTFPMMLIGITFHGISTGLSGLAFSATGLFLGISILLIPYLMGGMGAGDAKLMGAVGAMVGARGVVIAGIFSIILGLLYAIALLTIHHDYARSLFRRLGILLKTLFYTGRFSSIPHDTDKTRPVLRYALPIALGTMSYVVLKVTGSSIIQDLLGFRFSI